MQSELRETKTKYIEHWNAFRRFSTQTVSQKSSTFCLKNKKKRTFWIYILSKSHNNEIGMRFFHLKKKMIARAIIFFLRKRNMFVVFWFAKIMWLLLCTFGHLNSINLDNEKARTTNEEHNKSIQEIIVNNLCLMIDQLQAYFVVIFWCIWSCKKSRNKNNYDTDA